MNRKYSCHFLIIILLTLFEFALYAQSDLIRIDIEKGIKKKGTLNASDFVKEIIYIPLETSGNCLIRHIGSIKISKNYILISNTNPGVYLFNKDGSFKCKIGKRGKGPGEYNTVSDIDINTREDKIILKSSQPNKIIEYNLLGEFLKERKIDGIKFVHNIQYVSFDKYLLMNANYMGSTSFSYELYSTRSGELLHRAIKPLQFSTNGGSSAYANEFSFYYYENKFYTKENLLNDTLYCINQEGNILPRIIFDFGKYSFPTRIRENPGRFIEEKSNFIIQQKTFETPKHIILEYWLNNKTHYGYFDKSVQEFYYLAEEGIPNDIDKGLILTPQIQVNDELIGFYQAYELILRTNELRQEYTAEHKNDKTISLINLAREIDEESNPIIFIAKMKD